MMKEKRLKFLVTNDSAPSGFQANKLQSRDWVGGLRESGIDVIFLFRDQKLKSHNDDIHVVGPGGIIGRVWFWIRVLFYALRIKVDYYYVRSPFAFLVLGKKVIYEFHEDIFYRSSKVVNRIFTFLIRNYVKTGKIVLSVYISAELKHILNFGGLSVVLHDSSSWPIADAPIYYKQDEQLKITYVGSLKYDRKINRLISLASRHSNVRFIIAGNGEALQELKDSGLKNIDCRGYVERNELNQIINETHIFLGLWSYEVKTINFCSPLKLFDYARSGRPYIIEKYSNFKSITISPKPIWVEPESNLDLSQVIKKTMVEYNLISQQYYNAALEMNANGWKLRALELLKNLL